MRASSRGVASRLAAHEGDGQLAQPLEARLLLGRVLGREQRATAHAQALDQAVDEHVRAHRVELGDRRCGAARRTAGCVRAPPAGPAATRWRPSARTTRSSLRLRATWITRARSTWRSSIGGRASARTTAAASCGSTSRRIHASTSRTSARSRNAAAPCCLARRRSPGGAGAILETGTSLGYERTCATEPRASHASIVQRGRPRSGLRSWGGRNRLGRGPADRRARRRLTAVRGRARRVGRAARIRLRPARERLQRPRARRAELPALEAVDRPDVDRRQPEEHAPAAGSAHRAHGRADAGPLSGPLRSASGFLLGAQVGALTGMLSQRVLGQYDLALLDARGAAATAAARAEPRAHRAQPGRGSRRARSVGDHPRDHPRRPVLRRALAARSSRQGCSRS